MPGPLIGLEKRGTAPRPSKRSGQTGEPVRQIPLLSFCAEFIERIKKVNTKEDRSDQIRTATFVQFWSLELGSLPDKAAKRAHPRPRTGEQKSVQEPKIECPKKAWVSESAVRYD